MRRTRISGLALLCLVTCLACTPRYRLPQTEPQSQAVVTTAEDAYKRIYGEHKAQRVSPVAMESATVLYRAWRETQQRLIDAVRAGAITWAPAGGTP